MTEAGAAPDVLRIGLLGCGTVGSSVIRLLRTNGAEIRRRAGPALRVVRVAVAHPEKSRGLVFEPGVLTGDAAEVVADARVDVVAEVMGGVAR